MSVFDVRSEKSDGIEKIVFEIDDNSSFVLATNITRHYDDNESVIRISEDDPDEGNSYVLVGSAEGARYLQKALDKAIQLGWLK